MAALPFEGVEVVVVGDEVGAASAVKMSTASVYKGSVALLAQALRAADHYGVLEHVLSDLGEENVGRRIARSAAKAERYVGEMHEIAAAQSAAGLDPALFEALRRGLGGDRGVRGSRPPPRKTQVRIWRRLCPCYESASCRKSSMFERPTPTRRSGPGRSASARSSSVQATSPIVAASSSPAASVDERLRIEKSG